MEIHELISIAKRRDSLSKKRNLNTRTTLLKSRPTLAISHIYLCAILFIISPHTISGFNLDVNFSTIATIEDKNSYFGFSVGLYAGDDESWLLVGAPKSNKNGEIYQCKYVKGAPSSNCSIISLERDEPAASTVEPMFGLTMLPGPEGKQLLACAPYFTESTSQASNTYGTNLFYDLVGVCYFISNFSNTAASVYKINPCASQKGGYHDGDAYGQCELGFSAQFLKDGHSFILGAPRAFYQGSLMNINLPITTDIRRLPIHTGEVKPDIPAGWKDTEYLKQSYDENYLGYASASGKTIENNELLFVGAPARFRYNLYGMVIVFDRDMAATLYNFTGDQTGEYFGSAIASTDLNNDGLDDVIIGAPQYSAKDRKIYESGRVFIYYQLGASINEDGVIDYVNFSEPIIIEGTKPKARFGYTISAIGDVNQDGYQDIAIGAPYTVNDEDSENADGTVFIFNGGPEGLVIPASQVIRGRDLPEKVTSLGSSIYGGKDMDGNNYPDVIFGAYLSAQAVMFRSRPVVKITSEITVDPREIDLEKPSCAAAGSTSATNCFKITTCFTYTGKSVPKSIDVSYTYDIDSGKSGDDKRAFVLDEAPRNITLIRKNFKKSETECVEVYAFTELNIKDKLSDISIKVSHSLIARNEPVQPVLDDLTPSHSFATVEIYRDCGSDDICQADLRLESNLDVTELYAGQSWPFVMEQRIVNEGEPAFLSTLVVEYPEYVNYVGTQKEGSTTGITDLCTNDARFVTCEVGNPMKHNEEVNVKLKFQTLKLNGNFSQLEIRSFVNSTNPTNNTSEVTTSELQIGVLSEISIESASSPVGFYFGNEDSSKLKTNTTTIYHTYQISLRELERILYINSLLTNTMIINKGPSDFSKATIHLRWPLKTNDGKVLFEMQELQEDHKTVSCSAAKMLENAHKKNATGSENHYYCDGRANCASMECTVDGVFEQIQLKAVFRLPFETVLQNDYDSYIRSELSFKIDEYPYAISEGRGPTIESTVTTEFLYQRTPEDVAWWIVVIAVLAGLLCLLLLIFIMWKCGFFKRKQRPSDEDQAQKEALNPGSEDDKEMEEYLK